MPHAGNSRVYISQRRQLHCIGYHERRTRLNAHQMFRCLGHVWTRIFPYRGGNESLALCGTSWSYMECNIMNHVLCQEKQATAQLVLVVSDARSHDHCAKQPSLNASLFTLTHFSDTYQLISRSAHCEISPHSANSRSSIDVIVQGWPQQYSDSWHTQQADREQLFKSFFYCCTVHFDNIKILITNKCPLY